MLRMKLGLRFIASSIKRRFVLQDKVLEVQRRDTKMNKVR